VNVLVVHNHYQHAGGEDEVFRAETALLRRAGHDVTEYTRTNDEITLNGVISRAQLAVGTVWSRREADAIRRSIRRVRPDVVHFHNTFPLISPAAYHACVAEGVPAVQTLHNYRLTCPAATHFRAGTVCTACADDGLRHSIRHGCYRGSRAASTAVATMLTLHRALGTWRNAVDAYVVLSAFARDRFVASGLPSTKLFVKPNFLDPDPGEREQPGSGGLFVGRLWPEKGARTMVRAWRALAPLSSLTVIGDGPERQGLTIEASGLPSVQFVGRQSRANTLTAMKSARYLVFPSEWYEGLPMTIVEAFACGVPVIASRLGTMAEVVTDGETGLLFNPGDAPDLAAKLRWADGHPEAMQRMGRAARAQYEQKYTASANLEQMLRIYEAAIVNATARCALRAPTPGRGTQTTIGEAQR
jgi:glycosyltransferase involved in cell wall biosynthesis